MYVNMWSFLILLQLPNKLLRVMEDENYFEISKKHFLIQWWAQSAHKINV